MSAKGYYNTTRESGETLRKNTEKAVSQKEMIYNFFQDNPNKEFTPFEVMKSVFNNSTPITSVRRAMTDLVLEGKLTMTQIKRTGDYGRSNFCWMLIKPREFVQISLFD